MIEFIAENGYRVHRRSMRPITIFRTFMMKEFILFLSIGLRNR